MRLRHGTKVIAQKRNWDCGIACLAMLLNLSYGDVMIAAKGYWPRLPPNKRGIVLHEMEDFAQDVFGVELERIYRAAGYLEGQRGVLGIVGGTMDAAGHWVFLKNDQTIIDPDDEQVYDLNEYLRENRCRAATLLVVA